MRVSRKLQQMFEWWYKSHRRADNLRCTISTGIPVSAEYTFDHVWGGKRKHPAVYKFEDWDALTPELREEYMLLRRDDE